MPARESAPAEGEGHTKLESRHPKRFTDPIDCLYSRQWI